MHFNKKFEFKLEIIRLGNRIAEGCVTDTRLFMATRSLGGRLKCKLRKYARRWTMNCK